MDFEAVLKKLISAFAANKISYALIGGFALGIYGVVRATNDLDFLIDKKHENFLKKFMKQNAYEVAYESADVIQFDHPAGVFGSVDFLYAFRTPSLEMLKRAVRKDLFDAEIALNVLVPEDIIGLKVQSFNNNPKRNILDLEDIKNLMLANSTTLDWELVEKHFTLFKLNKMFKELKDAYATEK